LKLRALIVVIGALLPLTAAAAPSASSRTKLACVQSSDKAIQLRSAGQLRAAREELVKCGDASCPGIVREDCAERLRAVDGQIPSASFVVQDADGKELTDVMIAIDDAAPSAPSSRADSFDPGSHSIRVTRGDAELKKDTVVLREGEKNRIVTLKLPAPPTKPPPPSTKPPPPVTPEQSKPSLLGPIITSAIGIAAVGGAGLLSLHLDGQVSSARTECAPACSQDRRGSLSTELVFVNVTLIAGIAALAFGASWLGYSLISR
jgi:hypothetical protein